MTKPSINPSFLANARERAGFTQEDVALLVGQPRTVVSNWEGGRRAPSSHQLQKLAAIYRIEIADLLTGSEPSRPEFERLIFRDAGDRLGPQAKYEIQRFLSFLDEYGVLIEAMGERPGLMRSPYSVVDGFSSKEDIRRKAEVARDFLGLGWGPVGDLVALADVHGITVYQAPLGSDLKLSVSGAFLPHDRVGFSILVNTETTPGRRQFTLAHELAHALFHGDHHYVDYPGKKEAKEKFAHEFAAELLVPIKSLRSVVETLGLSRVDDAEVVVQIQRVFNVSYAMMLARLQTAGLITDNDLRRLKTVHPVRLAHDLGHSTAPDEWNQDPSARGLNLFPGRFLRLLREAFRQSRITLSGASAMTGLAEEDIESFLADRPHDKGDDPDFDYLRASA